VCGSDLWSYRGISPVTQPTPMGHEYCGIVEEVGRAVTSIKPGQFAIGSFFASDNTCPNCRAGYQSSCQHKEFVGGAQAGRQRVPLADGTLVSTPTVPSQDLIPSLLTLSDVMGTGWFAADAANVKPGMTVAVVGDGAVGLLGVLSAKRMGAERIIAMSRHESRQKLAREFGATDLVTERGDEGVARIKELTKGIGADAVLECVGTQESMMQAIRSTRAGGSVGYVGVPHGSGPARDRDVPVEGQLGLREGLLLRNADAPDGTAGASDVQRGTDRLAVTDALEDGVSAQAAGEGEHALDRRVATLADHLGGAEVARECDAIGVTPKNDDLLGTETLGGDDTA
jgi:threonine dehydrogenase-like Zn-dependent dehydrogenase